MMHGGENIPRLIFWELTKRCNLKCVHCRAEAGEADYREMGTDEIKKAIDEIASFAKPIMVLTGGEPLYRGDIFDIARHVASRGLRAALATNGTLIDGMLAAEIKASGIERVSISIDGADAATHDGFRGIEGCFAEALRGAAHLRNAGLEFQFNTTITRRNVAGFEKVLSLAIGSGARALHVFMLVPVGCGAEIAGTDMLSGEEYERVLNRLYELSRDTGFDIKATCAPHYYRIIRQRARGEGRKITFETDGLSAVTRGCLAGTGVCFISHRGDVQPCGYLPLVAGNVRNTHFREIWEKSELFNGLRDFSRLTGKCGECEYVAFCGGCRARAYYETGSPYDEEPYCGYEPARRRDR
jgi:heme b synthase